jgi:cardiolipin synthase
MDVWKWVSGFWQYGVAALTLLISLVGSGHALLYKRDTRAAVLWVAFIWLAPLVGAVLYFILGVNRIRRRAVLIRGNLERFRSNPALALDAARDSTPDQGASIVPKHLEALTKIVDRVAGRPLLPGNRIEPLLDGDEAYPAMLEAIAKARQSITLSTYIFDRDEAGLAFARALGDATRRGVEVRVLIDATGTRYSWPSILRILRKEKVRHARFLPAFPLWRLVSINLRNHRKILVVDGRIGFTGGMNLRIGHWLARQPRHPVRDIHFRIEGPIVLQMQEVFAEDWLFTTGESLRGEPWFPPQEQCGPVTARALADGPDENFEVLRWTILGALAAARHSVRIVTPYFVPDYAILSALNIAAMRGVAVDIVLPSHSNLPVVHWASRAHWWQVLERGCRIWLTPPPFDHSKIMIVDDAWAMIGSANWDQRSLRLNFEFNVECHHPGLAASLKALVDARLKCARPVKLEDVDGRSLPAKLRDGLARLLTPFI